MTGNINDENGHARIVVLAVVVTSLAPSRQREERARSWMIVLGYAWVVPGPNTELDLGGLSLRRAYAVRGGHLDG